MQDLGLLEGLLVSVINFIGNMIDLIPSFDLGIGDKLSNSIQYMANLVAGAGILIPVNDIFFILSLMIGFRLFMFTVFAVNWVIRRIADIIP
ncbi:hypothetical protein SAMN02745883_02431 [Caminicella sporogenes DSM 14501]|uniref:Uncharacterized protein n=1 Tax=Caminicella sporogenes DSM 14501 TaxID=1121266 RepID=A0A1M6TSL2_9FIRM|nr:hypothetical protein [Caminicella sporogenes]RKD23754.1 hypothetical protein BET04_11970 [Caminicella sporogenes]SHK60005.1 hypothetical protein SAMN02745883_02431 [Caminicella sporogenes DSM 14501]